MIFWLIVSVIAPWFASHQMIACFHAKRGGKASVVLWSLVALGLSISLSSCTYFLGLLILGKPTLTYCVFETLAFIVVGIACYLVPKNEKSSLAISLLRLPELTRSANNYAKYLLGVFAISLILGLLGVMIFTANEPNGQYDAIAIWSLRARSLFRLESEWRNAFLPDFWHSDYPLLISGSIARYWSYIGSDAIWIPPFVAVVFTIATVGLLTAGVSRFRGLSQGLLGGLLLLGTYKFMRNGAMLNADVPLSFYILATIVIISVYDSGRWTAPGLLVLAGVSAASAAWTKNEGMLFLVTVLASRTLVCWINHRRRKILREIGLCLVGVVPLLILILSFRYPSPTGNDLFVGQTWGTIKSRLFDFSRVGLIVYGFVEHLWYLGTMSLVVAALAVTFLGYSPSRAPHTIAGVVSVVLLMIAGYFLVYLVTPWDLAFHLFHSTDRLLIHLWPSMLFGLFLYLGDPVAATVPQGQETNG